MSLSASDHTVAALRGWWKGKRIPAGRRHDWLTSHVPIACTCLCSLSRKLQGTLGFHGLKQLNLLSAARVLPLRPYRGVIGGVFFLPSGT